MPAPFELTTRVISIIDFRSDWRRFAFVFLLISPLAASLALAQQQSATADIADMVRPLYDGERALETVAVLDQHVRWPGNRGFEISIDHIAERLQEFGYVLESDANDTDRLTYRVEEYPMGEPAWQPLEASITIDGEPQPVLEFASNRNMLAVGSHATGWFGAKAELIYAGKGSPGELDASDISGKIVMADSSVSDLVQEAIVKRGAVGVLAYDMPGYLQPAINKDSIQFRSIDGDVGAHKPWALSLSYRAREQLLAALGKQEVILKARVKVRWTRNAVERTVVADVRGISHPDERFVFSAHVQEPGANDNASGVGAQVEMARVVAQMVSEGSYDPARTVTFLWGDEIVSTGRYVSQNSERAAGIRWGMSLDMVGEDTEKTGGTFLIEKMPDPSAIWTRGDDQHSEWGGEPLTKEQMTPHYFNDLVLGRALEQSRTNGWVVKTNPFEGGSDHVPFLRAGIPGLLLWHFTDQFYHTDADRIDKVSPEEMKNVGVTALVTATAVTTADGVLTRSLVEEQRLAALERLATETELSIEQISAGGDIDEQRDIVETWAKWYDDALASMSDIEVGGSSEETLGAIEESRLILSYAKAAFLDELNRATPF